MIPQVLPHAAKFVDERDAEIRQMRRGPHARQHQQLRRADSPRAQDNFIPEHVESLAAAFHPHANRALALKQDAPRGAVRPNRQVKPMARHPQIADIRAPADALRVVERRGADARRVGIIQIRALGIARRDAGVIERLLRRQPLIPLEPPRDDRPIAAVKIVRKVGIRLQPPEIGHKLLKRPVVVPHSRPRVVIFRHAAQKHLPVDGAGSPRNLAARHHHRLRPLRRLPPELPVMIAHHHIRPRGVPIPHLIRQLVNLGIIRPRLQQQHGHIRILAKPRRHNRPRRPSPHHNLVILHSASPPYPKVASFRGYYTRRRQASSGRQG